MTTATRSTEVAAPVDSVWAVLADFGAIARWAPNVDHSSLMSEQTTGVGAVRRVQIGRTTLVERVDTWNPPHTLGYRLEGLPPAVREVTNTWTVESAGPRSHVTLTSRVEPGPRPPHRLAARLVARRLGAAADELLAGLAARLEESP